MTGMKAGLPAMLTVNDVPHYLHVDGTDVSYRPIPQLEKDGGLFPEGTRDPGPSQASLDYNRDHPQEGVAVMDTRSPLPQHSGGGVAMYTSSDENAPRINAARPSFVRGANGVGVNLGPNRHGEGAALALIRRSLNKGAGRIRLGGR